MSTNQDAPQRWGILARKSKVLSEEDARRELSTEAQIEAGIRAARREGAEVLPEYVWSELGSAFKERQRDDFEAALHALAEGKIDVLWVYMLDRFSRRGAEDLLRVIGKRRVIFDYDGLDSMNARDRRWIINRAEEAREYSERLSYNVKNTKRTQRDKGLWLGMPPYGLVADKHRQLHWDTSPTGIGGWTPVKVVIRILNEAAAGFSLRRIAFGLNHDHIPSPRGGLWSAPTVHRIIVNPVYEGWQVVEGASSSKVLLYRNAAGEPVRVMEHAPISAELAQKARANLKLITPSPSRSGTEGGKPGRVRLVAGRLRCEGCYGAATFSGGRSYACTLTRHYAGACPRPAHINAEALESYVVEAWKKRLAAIDPSDPGDRDRELLVSISDHWAALTQPKETQEAREARKAVKEAEAALKDLLEARYQRKEFEGAAARFYPRMLEEAEAAVSAAKKRASEYGGEAPEVPFVGDRELVDEAWEAATPEFRRDLLGLALRFVIIRKTVDRKRSDPTKQADIYWHTDAVPAQVLDGIRRAQSRKRADVNPQRRKAA
ncbi:recombinase family protein [Streptomyces sp. NPDC049585]|uniref:recombinase family protein n=1 Tax=Streptomyces sp. NPDC049585 TaxID=3155154 RepID=UPI003425F8DE